MKNIKTILSAAVLLAGMATFVPAQRVISGGVFRSCPPRGTVVRPCPPRGGVVRGCAPAPRVRTRVRANASAHYSHSSTVVVHGGGCSCSGCARGPVRAERTKVVKTGPRKWLGVGYTAGTPTGQGVKVVAQPIRLGIQGEASFGEVTDLNGLPAAMTRVRLDGRWVNNRNVNSFFRTYEFAGGSMLMANREALPVVDAGIGAELRIWRLGLGGEVGVTIPVDEARSFESKPGVMANFNLMLWLF